MIQNSWHSSCFVESSVFDLAAERIVTDVFISYSSLDRKIATSFVNALEAYGLVVWWDQHIEAGARWSGEIEAKLKCSRCVVVLWSQNSVGSLYVREEARSGLERDVLVPIRLNNCSLPFGFGEVQTADLGAWDGVRHDPALQRVIARMQRILPENNPIPTPEERGVVLEDRKNRASKTYEISANGQTYSVFVAEQADVEAIEAARKVSHSQLATEREYLEFVLAHHLKRYSSIDAAIDDQNRSEPRRPVSSLAELLQAVTDRAVASYRQQFERR